MPNYVKTRLTFNGKVEDIKKIKELVTSQYEKTDYKGNKVLDSSGNVIICTNEFDFNKVIPMPEELNIESGSSGDWGMRYLLLNAKSKFLWSDDDRSFMKKMEKHKKENPDLFNRDIELGKKYLNNIAKYGYKNWYDWACSDNGWNTKWNACEATWVSNNCVEFETAWSFCFNVVKKLSQLFPDIIIEFEYADEDCGSNDACGKFINAQEVDCEYPDTGSNRAYEIYLDLHPEYEDELVYDPDLDTYKWIE